MMYQHYNKCSEYKYETERCGFYEDESCMEGSRFLTLRINYGGM